MVYNQIECFSKNDINYAFLNLFEQNMVIHTFDQDFYCSWSIFFFRQFYIIMADRYIYCISLFVRFI